MWTKLFYRAVLVLLVVIPVVNAEAEDLEKQKEFTWQDVDTSFDMRKAKSTSMNSNSSTLSKGGLLSDLVNLRKTNLQDTGRTRLKKGASTVSKLEPLKGGLTPWNFRENQDSEFWKYVDATKFRENSDPERIGSLVRVCGIGKPVHETITSISLRRAQLTDITEDGNADTKAEILRGVLWNDDPEMYWFNNVTNGNSCLRALNWISRFNDAAARVRKCEKIGPCDTLTAKSHFGDLQFLHGMGSIDKEPPNVTLERMLIWAKFVYRIAIGELSESTELAAIEGLETMLPRHKQKTVAFLFGSEQRGDTRKRAIGSLLHMIQDSYALGHTQREVNSDSSPGRIIQFHSYAFQNKEEHKKFDSWGDGNTDEDRIQHTPGAPSAVSVCAEVLKFYKKKTSWQIVENYLRSEVFALSDKSVTAGPGDDFKINNNSVTCNLRWQPSPFNSINCDNPK